MLDEYFQIIRLLRTGKSETRISKPLAQTWSTGSTASCGYVAPGQAETNSNDENINDQNGKRQHRTGFVLNFEHLIFDIVSDFGIRIFITVVAFRQHVELPKSNTELFHLCG